MVTQTREFVNERNQKVAIKVSYTRNGVVIEITRDSEHDDVPTTNLERSVLRNMLNPVNVIEGARQPLTQSQP